MSQKEKNGLAHLSELEEKEEYRKNLCIPIKGKIKEENVLEAQMIL